MHIRYFIKPLCFSLALTIASGAIAQETSGIADRMKQMLVNAKEGANVLKAWSAYRAGDKESLREIFALAREGNPIAQNLAGWMLDNGDGVKQDSNAAFRYFSAASN